MKNITKAMLAAGATAALVLPLTFHANAGPDGKGGKFGKAFIERMDADGDGAVTKAEIESKRTAKFDEFDANKDGQLSADEFNALHEDRKQKRMEARFAKFDEDNNSTISAEEFGSRTDDMFERFDKNKDGKLTADELPKRGKGHHRSD